MTDIDGNEVEDVVRVLSIDEDLLKNFLTDEERPHHETMLNNDYLIEEIMEDGLKASVSIQWEEREGIAIGGLYMLPHEFVLLRKALVQPHNPLLGSDKQPHKAASRRWLHAGQRQRYTYT